MLFRNRNRSIPIFKRYFSFINIFEQNDKPYYHIYFDNYKEEYYSDSLPDNRDANKVRIIIDYQVTNLKYLFYYCKNIYV